MSDDPPPLDPADALRESLAASRTLLVNAPLELEEASRIVAGLLAAARHPEAGGVALLVSAATGDVTAALSLCDAINTLPLSVATLGLGELGPAGTLVLAAGTPGLRRALPHAQFHLKFVPSSASFPSVAPDEFSARREAVIAQLVRSTHLARGDVEVLLSGGVLMTAQDALAWGFVDEVATGPSPRAR